MARAGNPPGGPLAVGFGGVVALDRVVAMARPESAPTQRAVRRAEEADRLIDLSFGRRIRAVLFLDSGHVVKVAQSPETILARWKAQLAAGEDPGGQANGRDEHVATKR